MSHVVNLACHHWPSLFLFTQYTVIYCSAPTLKRSPPPTTTSEGRGQGRRLENLSIISTTTRLCVCISWMYLVYDTREGMYNVHVSVHL
jgi:hypothetical protein